MTNKDIKQYAKQYGYEIIVLVLKNRYTFVSWCPNSIPKNGSMTKHTKFLKSNADATIKNVILHRNKKLTLKTNKGFLQFFN